MGNWKVDKLSTVNCQLSIDEPYWLWLTNLKGIGPVTQRKLIRAFNNPKSVYEATGEELQKVKGLRDKMIDTICLQRSLDKAKKIQQQMYDKNIKLLTFDNPLYPAHVNLFSDQPAVLYYRGNLRPNIKSIGIIGSRRCTSYGKEVSAEAAKFLAKSGIAVVSGMAKGIDSYAHTACIKEGGYTLAFIANGPDMCYPPEHKTLMEEIIEIGAIISPYPPGIRPRQEYFPFRNKLMAAWVDKLLVVEAAERSGALITAKYAMDYKRQVFAVPNSIYNPESAGTNRLLQRGAEVYLRPEQMLETELHPILCPTTNREVIIKAPIKQEVKNTLQEELILKELNQPQEISHFLPLFDGDLSKLLLLLCDMELEGKLSIQGNSVSIDG